MTNGHSFVKDETLSVPEALVFGDPLEIFQDTTFKVVHLVQPCLFQERSRLFTPDATSSVHRDPRFCINIDVVLDPLWQFAK
jgi:hypothetical protein